MAAIIKIKRSSANGSPTILSAGELAYSSLTDNGTNGGDRLYIGIGSEVEGNAAEHIVIGGKYFTQQIINSTDISLPNTLVKRNNTGSISLNNLTLAGKLSTSNVTIDDSNIIAGSVTMLSTVMYNVDSFEVGAFRTAKYLIQATSGSQVHCTEVLLIHNNLNSYFTEYGIVYSLGSLFDLSTVVENNTVSLKAIPMFSDTRLDFIRTALISRPIDIAIVELEGDLSLLTGILDLMDNGDIVDLGEFTQSLQEDLVNLTGLEDLISAQGVVDNQI